MLIKYIKSVLWRVAKRLSYIEEARCLKVNATVYNSVTAVVMLRAGKRRIGILFQARGATFEFTAPNPALRTKRDPVHWAPVTLFWKKMV